MNNPDNEKVTVAIPLSLLPCITNALREELLSLRDSSNKLIARHVLIIMQFQDDLEVALEKYSCGL